MNQQAYANKTVVISGGNSGIGKACALAFARQGARLAILARNVDRGHEAVNDITAIGGEARFYPADVSQPQAVKQAFASIVRDFGGFDAAFNNAGTSGRNAEFNELLEPEFDAVMQCNVYGVYRCMKAQIDYFLSAGKSGAIVNCASVSGLVGTPYQAAYSASKHAVIGLTKSVALEYASRGIRINAVCPGGVMTPMLKEHIREAKTAGHALPGLPAIGRSADADEIASLVTWLCSDGASYLVGQAIAADGGFTVA